MKNESDRQMDENYNKTALIESILQFGLTWFVSVVPTPSMQLPAQIHLPSAGAALNKERKTHRGEKKKVGRKEKQTNILQRYLVLLTLSLEYY